MFQRALAIFSFFLIKVGLNDHLGARVIYYNAEHTALRLFL